MSFVPRPYRDPPAAYVTDDGTWPSGPFIAGAPPHVAAIAGLATALRKIADKRGLSQRGLARETGLPLASINSIYTGALVPDTATLAALEHALDAPLWHYRREGAS